MPVISKSYIQANSKKYRLLDIFNFCCFFPCIFYGARDHRKRSSIKYVRKIYQKINISYPLIRTPTCTYQRVNLYTCATAGHEPTAYFVTFNYFRRGSLHIHIENFVGWVGFEKACVIFCHGKMLKHNRIVSLSK